VSALLPKKKIMTSSNIVKTYQQHLRLALEDLLREVPFSVLPDVERALQEKGKLLYSPTENVENISPSGIWSLLTLSIAVQVNPLVDLADASNLAVAVECLICALDLLDDIEDEDQTPVVRELGSARVLNVSTALLALYQRAILTRFSSSLANSLLKSIQDGLLIATAAQHRDLLAEERAVDELTREECLEIAAGKAGALTSLSFSLGAFYGGASEKVVAQFARLGNFLGIAQQLNNDCHDLYILLQACSPSGKEEVAGSVYKSDLARRKKTLPFVLASQRSKIGGEWMNNVWSEAYEQSLREGIMAAWGIYLLYRERARACLEEINKEQPVNLVLRQLLQLN
jgi:geranylgeranyl pyrophosphate synthase